MSVASAGMQCDLNLYVTDPGIAEPFKWNII